MYTIVFDKVGYCLFCALNNKFLPQISPTRQHCLALSYIDTQDQSRPVKSSGHSIFAHTMLAVSFPIFKHLQPARQSGTISPVTSSPTLNVCPFKKHLSFAYVATSGHSKLLIKLKHKLFSHINTNDHNCYDNIII